MQNWRLMSCVTRGLIRSGERDRSARTSTLNLGYVHGTTAEALGSTFFGSADRDPSDADELDEPLNPSFGNLLR